MSNKYINTKWGIIAIIVTLIWTLMEWKFNDVYKMRSWFQRERASLHLITDNILKGDCSEASDKHEVQCKDKALEQKTNDAIRKLNLDWFRITDTYINLSYSSDWSDRIGLIYFKDHVPDYDGLSDTTLYCIDDGWYVAKYESDAGYGVRVKKSCE